MDSAFYFGLSESMKARHSRNVAGWAEAYAELEEQLAQALLALKVERANVVGLEAELAQMHKLHPNSPAKAPTTFRFKNGATKDFGRICFENAFDAHLKSEGITRTWEYRRN